ncbi:MAG: DUF5666 domain-containing protein [Candidatus Jorgensenbacteria bacterium]
MKKIILLAIIGIVVVGGAGFYGGMVYGKGQQTAVQPRGGLAQFGGQQNGGMARRSAGNFVGGEILNKDDKSITVKMQDARLPDGQGGSKIVFLSGATKVSKTVESSLNDLAVGENVTVNGTANPDGSVTAQSIQVRPGTPAQ